MDARKDRTALRLKLYENGFEPLANKQKMCLLKGWSTFEITPALISSREWARSMAYADTGIRGGDVVALDFDVDDGALLNALLDAVIENGIVEESPFVRIGRAPRELWVYRTSDKIGKRTTGHFVPPNSAPDFAGYAVEVLGKGCQFAAYGQRDENTPYTWPAESLLDHVYMELPEITLAQCEAVKEFAAKFFEANGLERRSPAGGTDEGYTHAYDLTDDLSFDVQDMGVLTVPEIAELLAANPNEVLRCTVDAFRPTSGSWAGMISLANGHVCLSDHGTYTAHFPPEADLGATTTAAAERLGALLAARFPEPAPDPVTSWEMDPAMPLDENLAVALERYVMVSRDALVCDLQTFQTLPMRAWKDVMGNYRAVKMGPQGGEAVTEMVDQWRADPRRKTALSMQMRPDQQRPLFREDNALNVNTYQPVIHEARGGDAGIGLDLIANLLPDPAERAWFLQWLAYKIRNPAVPGPAVVMVARDSYGTGRGSLISLLIDIFGERYVQKIDFDTLTGRGTQSQYNEWMSDSLIVAVDEAQESSAGQSRWQTRSNAYEHLKTVVDPSGRSVHIKRKTVKNSKAWTFASVFIATNHGDALVIPSNDRRFAILENGAPMGEDYWVRFHAWRGVPANVAAFVGALLQVSLEGYSPYVAPPMTRAKADMVDAGMSDIDRAANMVLDAMPGALLVRDQYLLAMEDSIEANGFDFPDDWQHAANQIFTRKTRHLLSNDRIPIEGKTRVVRMLRPCDPEILQSRESMLLEVSKNGPLVRQIRSTGKVVAFPTR